MEHPYPSVEFEATVGADGNLKLPRKISESLKTGSVVTIRLTGSVVTGSLHHRGVSEDEIEQIAELQSEARDHVVRFLEVEGALEHERKFAK